MSGARPGGRSSATRCARAFSARCTGRTWRSAKSSAPARSLNWASTTTRRRSLTLKKKPPSPTCSRRARAFIIPRCTRPKAWRPSDPSAAATRPARFGITTTGTSTPPAPFLKTKPGAAFLRNSKRGWRGRWACRILCAPNTPSTSPGPTRCIPRIPSSSARATSRGSGCSSRAAAAGATGRSSRTDGSSRARAPIPPPRAAAATATCGGSRPT